MIAPGNPAARGRPWHELRPLAGGMLALVVVMGFGRFSYTPLLPAMQAEAHFGASFAGLLASFNYAGYLAGAVSAAHLAWSRASTRRLVVAGALAGSALTTAAMGLTGAHWLWALLRAAGGVCSAWVLVAASSLIMDGLAERGQMSRVGVFYSGPGIGIALTGFVVPWLARAGGWRAGWLGIGVFGLALAIPAVLLLAPAEPPAGPAAPAVPPAEAEAPAFPFWGIAAAYGMEGLCYVVMATFVTVYFRQVFSSAAWVGDASWILVGLAAAPSTWLWTAAAGTWGWRRAAYAAFALQALGVLLPAAFPGPATAFAGSVLFGGTFMGISALALSIGRQSAPRQSAKAIGRLTAVFGSGQAAGPVAAGALAAAAGGYGTPMVLSGLLLLATVGLLRCSLGGGGR